MVTNLENLRVILRSQKSNFAAGSTRQFKAKLFFRDPKMIQNLVRSLWIQKNSKIVVNQLYFLCNKTGVVLVVFGVLVLIHGAALGGTGAGLWAGASALVAGALGVVATLSSPAGYSRSRFSSAHLASSLIALALSNMAVITAFTAVFRDSQKTPPDVTLLTLPVRILHLHTIPIMIIYRERWA